ncbi:MAG: hypothetical protein ACK559_00715, partial [bacterium]
MRDVGIKRQIFVEQNTQQFKTFFCSIVMVNRLTMTIISVIQGSRHIIYDLEQVVLSRSFWNETVLM